MESDEDKEDPVCHGASPRRVGRTPAAPELPPRAGRWDAGRQERPIRRVRDPRTSLDLAFELLGSLHRVSVTMHGFTPLLPSHLCEQVVGHRCQTVRMLFHGTPLSLYNANQLVQSRLNL